MRLDVLARVRRLVPRSAAGTLCTAGPARPRSGLRRAVRIELREVLLLLLLLRVASLLVSLAVLRLLWLRLVSGVLLWLLWLLRVRAVHVRLELLPERA